MFYNLFLHPLRKYPGPFFAGSTRAYYLWYDVRGLSHWKVNEWHQKYGPVIRIAPDELSCKLQASQPGGFDFSQGDLLNPAGGVKDCPRVLLKPQEQTQTAAPGRPSTGSPTRKGRATSRRTRSGGTRPCRGSSTSSTPTTRATGACAACRTRPSATRRCGRRSLSSAGMRRCLCTSCMGCAVAAGVPWLI